MREPADSGRHEAAPNEAASPQLPTRLKVIGLGAGLAAALAVFAITGGFSGAPEANVPTALLPNTPDEVKTPPPGTLGIRFDEVRDLWNGLERPPFISEALRRVPESGPFDSFSHSFDASAVVAGAYDPTDDYVVALMVRSSIEHAAISNMYLHVCHMLHPYSPQCIDNYFDQGLNGQTLEELSADGHYAEWEYEGEEWQVTVGGDIQTIRVIAPAAG